VLARIVDSLQYGLQVFDAAKCANLPVDRIHEVFASVKPKAGLSWTGTDLNTSRHYLRQPSLNESVAVRATVEVACEYTRSSMLARNGRFHNSVRSRPAALASLL
jgi:dephospho-CoA kinase